MCNVHFVAIPAQPLKLNRSGFTLIELIITIAIMGILIAIIIPAFKSSVRKANEASALNSLNAIKVAETKYVTDHKEQYGTFKQLFDEGYLDRRFNEEQPHHRGYIFIITLSAKTNGKAASFSINANPEQWEGVGATGRNFYYTDADNPITYARERPATAADDTL
jgi:prepilin-type N-terminal cleavage/methylation domain-containing protein